ncbi:MAG: HAMP domain-containing histidine kinase [Clostridiales bacterium]|nr:HAMP domain-containing histidine kinase [Clostridiales bacterium]
MIQRLRRKLVLIVMAVVTLMLSAIFFTMLLTTQQKNARMSVDLLRQALSLRPFPGGVGPPAIDGKPAPSRGAAPQMRLPVLVVEIARDGAVTVLANQLHFIDEGDIPALAALATEGAKAVGILPDEALRYLREGGEGGVRVAFADISVEREILQMQLVNSLLVGGLALAAFFLLSLLLARWAVRPVELAWEQQRQFVANASHELKTPLTVILSNADMLRAEGPIAGDKNARRIEHIHAEALRMKRLVEDMLTLARSDSRQGAEQHRPVDFSDLVTSAVLMYEPVFYDEGKRLSCEVEPGLSVGGDAPELQRLTHILLDNARKYSPPGGAVWVRVSQAEHRRALLTVASEGEPIPKGELERIFLRFYRRDASRSEHGSFGLGLSIAQTIVQAHRGSIWAESDETSGNRFFVSLPLA